MVRCIDVYTCDCIILCSGQFGLVYKALLRTDSGRKVDVAIKTIKKYDSKKETNNFLREMAVMSMLMHPNIIRLHGVVKDGPGKSYH